LPSRRDVLRSSFAAAAVLVLSVLRFPRIAISGLESKLESASVNPNRPENIEEVTHVISQARAADIDLSLATLESTGSKFIEAGQNSEASWDAAMALLAYRSHLNPSTAPASWRRHRPYKTFYGVFVESHETPHVSAFGWRPASDAAVLERISNAPLNVHPMGDALVIVENNSVYLDGIRAKNVIFQNCRVRYDGGQLQLDNVLFVNCSFEFVRRTEGLRLAQAILSASSTTTSFVTAG